MPCTLRKAFVVTKSWFQFLETRAILHPLVMATIFAVTGSLTVHAYDNEQSYASISGESSSPDLSTDQCADSTTKPAPGGKSILVPGPGFTGETSQPEPRGTGKGDDAKAIARWDVVPYQVFNRTINIGVVAFHINEIEKVSFSVEGGPWKDVHSMKLNPESNVVEYWVTLQASDFADGPVEVRAIAYPVTGLPRVLQGKVQLLPNSNTATTNGEHSMWLFANSGETLKSSEFFVSPSQGSDTNEGSAANPVKSLSKALALASTHDGSSIILTEAGEYYPVRTDAIPSNNNRWITVKPGKGLSRNDVAIVGAGKKERLLPWITRIRWEGLTFRPDTYSYINEFSDSRESSQWYDDCLLKTPQLEIQPGHWRGNVYATNSRIESFTFGFYGVLLARGCVVKDVLDAYVRSQFVVNCSVERARSKIFTEQHHPDLYQSWGDMKNIIVYGMKGDEIDGMQILFINQPLSDGPDMTDAAFVDIDVKTYDKRGEPPFSQLQGPLNHVLFKNVKLNQKIVFRTEAQGSFRFVPKNVVFEDCRFYNRLFPLDVPRGITLKNSKQKPKEPQRPQEPKKPQ